MDGTRLFWTNLAVAVGLGGGSLILGGYSDLKMALHLGLVAAGVWFVYMVVSLYLAGRFITRGEKPGQAGVSVVLLLLLTPVVLAAPVIAGVSSGYAALEQLTEDESSVTAAPAVVQSELQPVPEDLTDGEAFAIEPGVVMTDDEVDEYYLAPMGVSRANMSEATFAAFADCARSMDAGEGSTYEECVAIVQ